MRLSQLAPPRGLSSVQPEPPIVSLGKLALLGFGAFAAIKVIEVLVDEEFDGIEFPASFRRRFIDEHVRIYGRRCLACRRGVLRRHLTVDHIVALANGGRTSRANAQIRCRSCNSSKGSRNGVLDHLRGRR